MMTLETMFKPASRRPTDPFTFVVISFSLALVALAACYFPARRATRIDPAIALRSE